MKVNVPKELRPPERFDAFWAKNKPHSAFKVSGAFRGPRVNEWYFNVYGNCVQCIGRDFQRDYRRVILEKIA